jgi:hypothetical protein
MESSNSFLSPRVRAWIAPLLLIFGVQLWLILGRGYYGTRWQLRLLLAALIISIIPPIARFLAAQLDRLRHPSHPSLIAIAIALLSCEYFVFTAHYQHHPFIPEYLDEQSYAIGIQMAAHFHLWMPQHPLADFFEGLELIVRPVYASMYFPGTAMLYAPSIWLGLPYWILPAMAAGACVGLTYRIVTELLDGVAGILCALMLVGTSIFRLVSIMLLAQVPVLLMILLTIWAWLKWRNRKSFSWAIAMGFFATWAAICRPLDALAMLLPVGVAILIDARPQWRTIGKTFAAAAIGGLPFLVIQIAFNLGVSGSWYRTPFQFSQERDYPQTSLGFHAFDPNVKPASSLPQKQMQYQSMTAPAIRAHQLDNALPQLWHDRLPEILRDGLPNVFLIILLPPALLMLDRRGWVIAFALPCWVGLSMLYVFQLAHYAVVIAPVLAMLVVCGIEAMRQSWPKFSASIAAFFTLAIIILSVTETAELNRFVKDEWIDPSALLVANKVVHDLPQKPAVILFKYDPSLSSEIEPVYNIDVAWPDDAPVIRAHDLGPRNVELFNYYALHQPNRAIYEYDRASGSLHFLGRAKDLAK